MSPNSVCNHTPDDKQIKLQLRSRPILLIGSFSIDDGNGNYNPTNYEFDWSSEEKYTCCTYTYVRHALMNKSVSPSVKQQRDFTTFTILMT